MIEWLRRADPNRPFLIAEQRTWSYREVLAEVERRSTATPRLSKPSLTPDAIFDVLAGIASGGLTVVGPEPETKHPYDADLVVFTSGTSGPPKGVRLTLANLEAAARASVAHLGHGPDDVWLLAMPLHHVGGLSILVRQAYSGGAVLLQPRFEPDRFTAAIETDGALRVVGRADAVIVTGGENVNPEHVEAVLREHEGVVDVCVVGVVDEEWGQIVVAVFEGSAEAADILSWAAGRMPVQMVPKRMERLDRIPRGAIGKPDRQAVVRSVFSERD